MTDRLKLKHKNGVVVEDLERVEEGDKIYCVVKIRPEDTIKIYMYWNNRTRVKVIDAAGVVYQNCRVVIKDYELIPHFENYWKVRLEFWRV